MPKTTQKLPEGNVAPNPEPSPEISAYAAPAAMVPPAQPQPSVSFTAEQIAIVNKLVEDAVKSNPSGRSSPNNPISVYNVRDPRSIETVNVRRFDGKFVMGFKDLQTDPYKKVPKYYKAGVDPVRKLVNEPYVVLLLSEKGEEPVEKEVLLIDYMNERNTYIAKVLKINEKEVIHDHGILGARPDSMGVAINDKGIPEQRTTILAQSKSVEREFVVQLPEFPTTSTFISDFLA